MEEWIQNHIKECPKSNRIRFNFHITPETLVGTNSWGPAMNVLCGNCDANENFQLEERPS